MIFIGDISVNDKEVLRTYAFQSNRILEFGVGMSTQVMRHYSNAEIISVETAPEWIEKTRRNLKLLGIREDVDFRDYYTFVPDGEYDLIFDDGAMEFRLPFAELTWKHLKIGGKLLIHDSRSQQVVDMISEFLKKHSPEIYTIEVNFYQSNITVITKRNALFYEDWSEGKPAWLSGYEEVNEEELKKMMDDIRVE